MEKPRIAAESHLGNLAKYLRFGGFDVLYDPEMAAAAQRRQAREEDRTLLSRSPRQRRKFPHLKIEGWVPAAMLAEVVAACGLHRFYEPFSRCMRCNEMLERIDPQTARDGVPPGVAKRFNELRRCPCCGRIYWKGTHYERMERVWSTVLTGVND